MATYAIGDVQGCYAQLRELVDATGFDPASDRLWFVGDLVNRGPDNVSVLRFVKSLGAAAVAVLGNHDLHLLACAAGIRKPKRRDTLRDVLGALDRDELLAWVRALPLVHRENGWLMVHAGLAPQWTLDDTVRIARETEDVLRSDEQLALLTAWQDAGRSRYDEGLPRTLRAAAALAVLTLSRTYRKNGDRVRSFAGPPADAPRGAVPWFDLPDRRWAGGDRVVFGHWAALGLHQGVEVLGLDSGCVWGGRLTAVRLEDEAVFQV